MKKKYIQPGLIVVKLHRPPFIMAGSEPLPQVSGLDGLNDEIVEGTEEEDID